MLGIRINEGCKRWLVTWVTAGLMPAWLACVALLAVPAGSYAAPPLYVSQYAGGSGQSTVTVIDTETDTVLGTLPAGKGPAEMAVSPDGRKLYVLNVPDSFTRFSVSIVNTEKGGRSAVGLDGVQPSILALAPDGRTLYVGWWWPSLSPGVEVIDAVKRRKTGAIGLIGATQPQGMALTGDGAKLYVGNFGSGQIMHVIDTASSTATPLTVGAGSFGVVLSPLGDKVYVAVRGADPPHISVIDTTTDAVIGTVGPTDAGAAMISILPDNSKGYVTGAPQTFVFDPQTDTLNGTLLLTLASGIQFLPDGSKGYSILYGRTAVGVFDPASDTIVKTIPVAEDLDSLVLGPRVGLTKARLDVGRSRYKLRGRFTVDAGGVIDPLSEPVTLTLSDSGGIFVQATVPVGSFRMSGNGRRYRFRRRPGELPAGLDRLTLRLPKKPHDVYIRFDARAADVDLSGVAAGEITVKLQIGDDVFETTMPFVSVAGDLRYP